MKKSEGKRVERCFVVNWIWKTEYGAQEPLFEYFFRIQSSRYLLDIIFSLILPKTQTTCPFLK